MSLSRRHFLVLTPAAAVITAAARWAVAQVRPSRPVEAASAVPDRNIAAIDDAGAMKRTDDLLRRMTLEEKAMQLSCVVPLALLDGNGLMRGQADALIGRGIGHVAGIGLLGHKSPEVVAKSVNAVQRYLVTQTRLKIPAIFHNEALNGVVAPGFSAFPTPIGLAATWNPDGVRQMADIMRRQMRATGMLHALAPVMDVARDARWGRVTETYGEDPYLVSAMSVAFTRGMQGSNLREGVLVCAKHFVGYAMTEGGQNMAATLVGPRELYDVYARPFEAAIRLAGLAGVMASYSEYEGVPIHVSRAVLTDLLRGRMGFTGTVVSDYNGVGWAQTRQVVASTPEDVGALALAAGMDVELPGIHGYGMGLVQAVRAGKVSETQLDESVRRVLRDKFALGLFENPYVREDPVEIRNVAGEGDELSRRLAAESVTLLKNDGNLLPLARSYRKVAVIGPHADSTMIGFPHYTFPAALPMLAFAVKLGKFPMPGVGDVPKEGMAALQSELAAASDQEDYARKSYRAVSLAEAVRKLLPDAQITAIAGTGVTPSQPVDIDAAVAAAKAAELVILYVGGKAGWVGDDLTEKEGGDTANIDLPPQQVRLVKAIVALRKPTVAVVSMGRPQGLSAVIDDLPAVLTAYYGGPHQGMALAEAIFGLANPQRQAAAHAAAARWTGAHSSRTAQWKRLSAKRGRHSSRLSRHALDAAVPLRARAQLHDVRVRRARTREQQRRRFGRPARVAQDQEYRQAARHGDRAALRRRYRDRYHPPRTAARRLRASEPRAARIQDGHLRRTAQRARLYQRIGRSRHGTGADRSERRQQLERRPNARDVERHGKDAESSRRGSRIPVGGDDRLVKR